MFQLKTTPVHERTSALRQPQSLPFLSLQIFPQEVISAVGADEGGGNGGQVRRL